jgi:hypothetical protein
MDNMMTKKGDLLLPTFCLFIFSFLFLPVLHAQRSVKIPANFPGFVAGIEWNTISGVSGLEYERSLYFKKNIVIGVRGTYIFKYRTGNMQLLNRPCCEISGITTLMGTANIFTSTDRLPTGFFFLGGAGLGLKIREFEQGIKESRVTPAVEAGIGWLFPLGSGLGLKWSNTVTFPSKQGGITFTRLALGF